MDFSRPVYLGNAETEDRYFGQNEAFLNDISENELKWLFGEEAGFTAFLRVKDVRGHLPLHTHPTLSYAEAHLNASAAGSEAFLVLEAYDGACLYHGFRESVSEDELESLPEDELFAKMNVIPLAKGDVCLLPAGIPHAPKGVKICIVREPLDTTFPYTSAEFRADANRVTGERAVKDVKCVPWTMKNPVGTFLVSPGMTSAFSMALYTLKEEPFLLDRRESILTVTEGEGTLSTYGFEVPVKKGDTFFLPHVATRVYADGSMTFLIGKGGKPSLCR